MILVFGDNLRRFRKERGVKQDALAEYCKIEKSSISRYESNQTAPSIDVLCRIADFFDVSLDSLVGRVSNDTVTEPTQTPDVEELVRLYSGMNLESRAMVLSFMRALAESPKTKEARVVNAGT